MTHGALPDPYPGDPNRVAALIRPLVGAGVWAEYERFVREQQRQADSLARLLADAAVRVRATTEAEARQ